tara:strand:- start:4155 stop:4427 length:273 start_codon:yes stop_codon:yes gene_type:complete
MSISKKINEKLTLKDRKDLLSGLIVDMTDSAFHLKIANDDAGAHLHMYLPESSRQNFNLKRFRKDTYKLIGSSRVVLSFVTEGYIETFLK